MMAGPREEKDREGMRQSNLECFLNSTTPRVRHQIMPKTGNADLVSEWQSDGTEYFRLLDLWDCYDEWSAYGVGAPIVTSDETVVQYYTPYLSAIQIFMAKNIFPSAREDFDGEFEDKSWGSESECEKLSRSSSNNSDRTWYMENLDNGMEGYLPGRYRLGELYFEYFESDVPFGRVPLKEKIDDLSRRYPGLKTFSSVDLSAASWMAVAWYPIYHIPSCRHGKELYASFLTYHTLSSQFQDVVGCKGKEACCDDTQNNKMGFEEYHSRIPLHPFGLAAYRMQPQVWLNPETSDMEKLSSLECAASSWLKQLQVQHHDYNFFATHLM